MRAHLVVIASLVLASTAAAGPKPAVQGTYAFKSITPKGQPEQDVGKLIVDALKSQDVVWGRFVITFDGAKLTMASQQLIGKPGDYHACMASVTAPITWKAKAFVLAGKVESEGKVWTFKTLTANDSDQTERHCSASLDGGTFTVKSAADDKVVLIGPDGSSMQLVAVKDGEAPEWRKYVPTK